MRHARHARLFFSALFAVILFVGCGDESACDDDACKTSDTKYGIADRTIHAVDEKTFEAEEVAYTLVRVEFGDSHSVYCGFIVKGVEYPVYGDFVTEEDELFDDDEELTGLDLPIMDDDAFDEWLWETDDEDDVLIECFSDY